MSAKNGPLGCPRSDGIANAKQEVMSGKWGVCTYYKLEPTTTVHNSLFENASVVELHKCGIEQPIREYTSAPEIRLLLAQLMFDCCSHSVLGRYRCQQTKDERDRP